MTNFGIVELARHGIDVQLDGKQIDSIKIPSDWVPYTFAPILGHHHMLSGDKLVNGMLVVVADNLFRENPEKLSPEYPDRKHGFIPTEYNRDRIMETSRWALVTDLQKRGNLIEFTAIYSDGTMRPRSYNQSIKWAALVNFEVAVVEDVCAECGLDHSAPEFAEKVKEDVSFLTDLFLRANEIVGDFFDELSREFDASEAEIPADRPQRPDETDDEYADRLRDEDEAAGEYNANEAARLKKEKLDEEALAALREKLAGAPRSTFLADTFNRLRSS